MGQLEVMKNELEDYPIENFPNIKFFIRGRKKEAFEFKGPIEKNNLLNFVKEHSTLKFLIKIYIYIF